jgi:archaellum component FlaC
MSQSSDLQKILSVLGTIQNDIKDLKIGQEGLKEEIRDIKEEIRDVKEEIRDVKLGQELMKLEQEGMKEELRTMKVAATRHVDNLSTQMVGVVNDFAKFGVDMRQLFDQWKEKADSRVTDKVMAIQGPRIRAMEDRVHEFIKAG